MTGQVEGMVAIITGAGRGLGREYATRLSAEGANVVVADIRDCDETVAAVEAGGGDALGLNVDVTDMAACSRMAAQAQERFGRIDILVNNAALYGGLKNGRFDQLDDGEWDRVLSVNVTGIWHCCKAVASAMRDAGGGSIINMSSLAAVYGMPYALHYTTSKAAVIGLTRGLARELGRNWIRVNAIAPSAVMTDGTSEFFGDKLENAKQVIAEGQTLQQNLQPEDIAGTVLYLASDASKFVTGQTFMVDGGTVYL